MTAVLAIDPGTTESAWVILKDGIPKAFGKESNDDVLAMLVDSRDPGLSVVIEKIACYGMAVGEEVFETVFWTGRFAQSWEGAVDRITRKEVALHICNSPRASDANVRCALIDRFGGKEAAVGRKNNPGPLYGISGDCWAALAVGITWIEKQVTPT